MSYHKPSNYKDGKPRRYELVCVCGGRPYQRRGAGLRKSSSRKTGCLFRLKLVQQKTIGDRWVIGILHGDHNHYADDPITYPEHRTLHLSQIEQIQAQSHHIRLTASAIKISLRAKNPDILVTAQDIYNIQRTARLKATGSLTATQAMIKEMDENEVFHVEMLDTKERLYHQLVNVDTDFKM